MSSQQQSHEAPSPSPSTLFLPLGRRSRRDSITSLSSVPQTNKETLSQALDQIHSAAAQSGTLTTFNDFASPPLTSSGGEGKGFAGDLVQGGISGLYDRFRASVGGVRDIVGGRSSPSERADFSGSQADSRLDVFEAKPAAVVSSNAINASLSTLRSEPGSHLQSPIGSTGENLPTGLRGSHTKNSSSTTLASKASKVSKTSNGSGIPSGLKHPPSLAKPTPSTATVSAIRSTDDDLGANRRPSSSYADMRNDSMDEAFTETASIASLSNSSLEPRSIPPGSKTGEGPLSLDLKRGFNESTKAPGDCNYSTFNGPIADLGEDDTNRSMSLPELMPPVSKLLFASQSDTNLAAVPNKELNSTSTQDISGDVGQVNGVSGRPNLVSKGSLEKSMTDSVNNNNSNRHGVTTDVLNDAIPPESSKRISPSHLPGYRLSRTSTSEMTETTIGRTQQTDRPQNIRVDQDRDRQGRRVSGSENVNTNPEAVNAVLSHIKSKVLSRDYWMRDENAKDCFYCGDAFSTFRRKHHCRACGQIFDAKCTSLVPGKRFDQSGNLRVCKPCEAIINGYDDDSSDFSEDEVPPPMSISDLKHLQSATDTVKVGTTGIKGSSQASVSQVMEDQSRNRFAAPTMAIPATRRTGDAFSRRSAVLEIDGRQRLPRPGSSRSLKSAGGMRPHSSGHKRYHSRQQHFRNFKHSFDDRAPFHRNMTEDSPKTARLPAFHNDSIIDPELAAFMSDEESSEDEQMSIWSTINGTPSANSHTDNDKAGITGLLAAVRKGRSKLGDKSLGSFDDVSIDGSKVGNQIRTPRKRNMSSASNTHPRPVTRSYKGALVFRGVGTGFLDSTNGPESQEKTANGPGGFRMTRSASMKGSGAPAVELNHASLQHVRKLLRQLLQDSSISGIDRWEKALLPILLQSTDDVNPDVQHGDDMDIRHYVKLKKIPAGRPDDTSYISGVVFSKNLALKSMPRSIPHPRIVIVTFALEYARHQQHFMSLGPVIAQEREFLENIVNRIAALRPQLLLVQRNVSGLALQFLEEAGIATAYNVKPSVIEAISRCTQARVISSIDKLAIKPAQLGKCASFDVKTYVHGGRKKTYLYLSGCAKDLGCTIVLRGAEMETLATIKRITEFMIYVVYNLKLETCLMRDEFVLIPSCTTGGTLSSDLDIGKDTKTTHTGSTVCGDGSVEMSGRLHGQENRCEKTEMVEGAENRAQDASSVTEAENGALLSSGNSSRGVLEDLQLPDDVPMPTSYADMVEKHKTKILSASPFVKFMQPYLLMRAREQERRLLYLKRLRDEDSMESQTVEEKDEPQKFDLITPEMVHETIHGASKKVREVLHAVHDAEYDKALHSFRTQRRQWEAFVSGSVDLFDPYAHQNIVVLYSLVCTTTTVPCSGPDLLAMDFYNEHDLEDEIEADCTLGQYVEDLCLGANTVCMSNGCDRKMVDHHRQYVHGEAQVSVFVQNHPSKLQGMQDTILMWSCCRICNQETQVIPMSDSTWRYSFGKYLELSFWSNELHPRADVCPHDLHRDHLRYFGYKDAAIRIHYDPINLFEIIVPRARVTWKVDHDLRLKNEQFERIEEKLNRFMATVKNRIKGISVESVVPEKSEACKLEVEKLLRRANEEHSFLIRKLRDKYMDSKYYEIIPLNRAIRAMQEKVAEWDSTFAEFERSFFPSENDIRRLAALQLKKIFLDRDDSVSSIVTTEDDTETPLTDTDLNEKMSSGNSMTLSAKPTHMSPEKAHDVFTSVVEEQAGVAGNSGNPGALQTSIQHTNGASGQSTFQAPLDELSREGVHQLDLAVPSDFAAVPVDAHRPTRSESKSASPASTRKVEEAENTSDRTPSALEGSDMRHVETWRKVSQGAVPESSHTSLSGIPRPAHGGRRGDTIVSPPLYRGNSHPTNPRREPGNSSNSASENTSESTSAVTPDKSSSDLEGPPMATLTEPTGKGTERKLTERLGLAALKPGKHSAVHSFIPRSVANRRKDSKVTTLAKHFEQLSREFEKERLREKRMRSAGSKQARAFPMASSKPIVEVYRNVHEAVAERGPSDDDLPDPESQPNLRGENVKSDSTDHTPPTTASQASLEESQERESVTELTENEDNPPRESLPSSDIEAEGEVSDVEHALLEELQVSGSADESRAPSPTEPSDLKIDLPKHERSSLMKMLTNFWAERSASGWDALDYPLIATDHVFADSDIVVREDEPSSLIAFALGSEDYMAKLRDIRESDGGLVKDQGEADVENETSNADRVQIERSLLRSTGTHLKYQFQEGSAKMLCKVFYAEQFDALRRKCGVSERIVDSLSRCLKWDSKGGKTKSVFLKTLDDRFVLKSLSPIETQAFLKFAPAYFQIMSEALFHELPSVIAKMLGFYQVIIKNANTGIEFNWYMLLMENLFYDRSPTRIFDLKGSMRNRYTRSNGAQNEVLLDENMVEFIYESPLFTREHSKKLLRASVWNDTLFLARQNVMDYSLMIAIDEVNKELVVGIIDCIRTYTWDKKLETWIKDRGKNRPTVTSPKEYKSRFREAMNRYVLQAPNCWHQYQPQPIERRPLRIEEGMRQESREGDRIDAEFELAD
ncbi:MAG: hypothetical protein M1819_002974 [Sarea resinae]|nr:MAG: hypothetical protein M1819_002974 [Sarea resinae]